jgi:N4-gp56 family major capsid protein
MTSKITTKAATSASLVPIPDLVLTVYSKMLETHALPAFKYDQFATVKTDLSATPGEKITFFKYDNLTRGGELTEGVPMETQALAGSQVHLEVTEYGNAVAVTNLLLVTSFADIMRDTAMLLGRDYTYVIDELARDTLMLGGNVIYADSKTDEDDLEADSWLTMSEVKDGAEYLASVNAPRINGDHWLCIVSPHQSRRLRDDPDWITVAKLDPPRLYKGEIGRVDDVVFVLTTQVDVTANSQGTPVDVHTAVMLGANAFGKAVALPVEMRDNGVEDFGRQRSLGWYSILGEGILNEDFFVQIKSA